MRIIYCDNVFDSKVVEPDYEAEMRSANSAGFDSSLISFEELNEGNIAKALRLIPMADQSEMAIYRGWMLTPKVYKSLYDGLLSKNVKLINDPSEYTHCHYLPESYEIIKEITPTSNWSNPQDELSLERIDALTDAFGQSAIIVKDYVKSQKHNWAEACFIPDASDKKNVHSVVEKFLEFRGTDLNVGLVFRKFEELEFLTKHSKSGMPLTKEFRVVFAHDKVVAVFDYWDEGDYGTAQPELEPFIKIAQKVKSNFFSMDVAKKKNGDWILMELGDGQVAGLPDNADVEKFYESLKKITSK